MNTVMERDFADCVEQLVIANIKLTIFDHQKADEIKKDDPDLAAIARWEAGARAMNERRSESRHAINQRLDEAIKSGENQFFKDVRTFG
jgi:hypothetical protein